MNFFEKPTINPKILMADSAINAKSKRTILTQECLRHIRNTKIELGDAVRNDHLNRFMIKMKNSGYSKNYRIQILNSALNAFEKMVEEDKNGTKPLYRNREWNKENRVRDKEHKRNNWYKNDTKTEEKIYKSILFVPPTPGSGLLKELKSREEELNKNNRERIKIVEKGGRKIEKILTKKNPFKEEKCQEKWCPLCKGDFGEFDISCKTNNTGYRWVCKTCEKSNKTKAYEGETSRSIRIRSIEHIRAFKAKKSDSVLYKHKMLEHINEDVEYGLEITGMYRDALTRQANESVRIYNRNESEILNSKSEFNHPPTARVMIEKKRKNDYKAKQAQFGCGNNS